MLTKNCKKAESCLLFSYGNTFIEATSLRPIKAVRLNERSIISVT